MPSRTAKPVSVSDPISNRIRSATATGSSLYFMFYQPCLSCNDQDSKIGTEPVEALITTGRSGTDSQSEAEREGIEPPPSLATRFRKLRGSINQTHSPL